MLYIIYICPGWSTGAWPVLTVWGGGGRARLGPSGAPAPNAHLRAQWDV